MVVKAENIVANMNGVIRNVIGKGRATLAMTDLNLLKQTIWRNNREPTTQTVQHFKLTFHLLRQVVLNNQQCFETITEGPYFRDQQQNNHIPDSLYSI